MDDICLCSYTASRTMRQSICILAIVLLISSSIHAKGDPEPIEAPARSAYEVYFRSLSPEEQAVEYVTRFTEAYGLRGNSDLWYASRILKWETGLEAMPYLKREFARLEFEYCPDRLATHFCNQAPAHVLGMISDMVWLSGFPKNEGSILRPSDEDIEWFVEETRAKIHRYISRYKRIDGSLASAEFSLRNMGDKATALAFWDAPRADNIRVMYETYVRGDPELEGKVGLYRGESFEGFEGPFLDK